MTERRQTRQAELLRRAILSTVPKVPAVFDQVPARFVYDPPHHGRALDPSAMLVTGTRGAGKSFWWFALQDEEIRRSILKENVTVSVGFGQGHGNTWPDRDELQQLLTEGCTPRVIWKAVVLRQIAATLTEFSSWLQWVSWVSQNPSPVATRLRDVDSKFERSGEVRLVLFDALDRAADTRADQERLLSGLLQLVLELRSFRALRAKVFARPDMLEGVQVTSFSDASKVLASAVKLEWRTLDLFGLLFQYLGNGDNSDAVEAFRRLARKRRDPGAPATSWRVPSKLREDEQYQKEVFEAIAGPYMGTNARRGKTYTWVPNHLADGLDAVSPRSFLAAIGRAAEEPMKHDYALHWSGLHEGVRHASTIRVDEVQEDLPWAHEAMRLLENLVVPCTRPQILQAWRKGGLFTKGLQGLPDGDDSVLKELGRTGILRMLPDGRINIPDVYRLGFGLRRKGGFAPRR